MTVIDSILGVFMTVAQWFGGAFDAIIPMFWIEGVGDAAGSLTFMGTLAIAGMAIGVVFLLLRVVSNFLQFRA